MDALLEIKNLKVTFLNPKEPAEAVMRAVDGVSLDIQKNSFTSIVGESGSGKTVTALSICRLTSAHDIRGQIIYKTETQERVDLLKISQDKLLKVRGKVIAYIFQDPGTSLNPVMRVGEQIVEAAKIHFHWSANEAKLKALEAIRAVKLKDPWRITRSFPHELSGGMKQRVMIAMALIMEPKILIADEPTTALDAATEFEMMALLAELKKSKALTILFVTHDLSLAMGHSNKIIVMQKGKVVERMEKNKDGFLPKEIYTKRLFNAQVIGLKPKSIIEV
ncbi:MAG: hypothetical protein AUJ72_02200 [Candidatus Omnitrophica bacterium CG1_02_46_14]|nr:MAG: hypothetical protein AUJ72_02200 [Candidatus Omnitrophica bacterium CG1_02_46_14]